MALRALMLNKKIEAQRSALDDVLKKLEELKAKEDELEQAVNELNAESTQEEKDAVQAEVDQVEAEKDDAETKKEEIQAEIDRLQAQLEEEEKKQRSAQQSTAKKETREKMETTKKFFGLSAEQRDKFFADSEVKDFLQRFRELGKNAAAQNRAVSGADLTIPTVMLDLIRENIEDYSKLIRRVHNVTVSGKARQTVMGTIPEAVWTEMCAKLNELNFTFNAVEVDGYKIGGYVAICNATLEDSDINLATEIITGIGAAIGIGLDKAYLYGLGTKMPLGIVTRLAQSVQPSDYPATARPWEDLQSHLVTIDSGKTGLELYKEIVKAGGLCKSKYSRGTRFWAMNEATYTALKVEAMNFNAAGAIVAFENGTMPVAGGDIVVLSDDIIPDKNIVAGYGDLYLSVERQSAQIARSDDRLFIEDQAVFRGTARYDGLPVIPEAFVAIGLGAAPQTSATFPLDTANDATLQSLEVGTETLAPTFAAGTYAYTVTAAGTSGNVFATPTQPGAKVEMTYDGKQVVNGGKITFSGTKDLAITVKNGLSKLTYTVAITKGE